MNEILKVAIIDDEDIVIQDLKSLIDWESTDYRLSWSAYNERQARRQFVDRGADIVFMDIALPGTNGLDLSREFKTINPKVVIIILSSYMEFSYARRAIDIGIFTYIVKHELTPEMLIDTLDSAHKEIMTQRLNQVMLEQHILRSLINHECDEDEYVKSNLSGLVGGFYTALFFTAQSFFGKDPGQKNNIQVSISSIKSLSKDNFMISNILTLEFGILIIVKSESNNDISLFLNTYDQIIDMLSEHSEAKVFCLYNQQKDHIFSLSDVVGKYYSMKKYTFFADHQQRFTLSEIEYHTRHDHHSGDVISFNGDIYNKSRIITELQKFIQEWNISDLEAYCYKLNEAISAQDHSSESEKLKKIVYSKELIDYYSKRIGDLIDKERNKENISPSTRYVLKYIDDNYKKNITLIEVADRLQSNSMYIGQLFIHDMHTSFHNYLTAYRIERAKSLLLRDDAKIHKISEEVGFSNSQYFTKSFKSVTGLTPSEFRDKNYGFQNNK